MENLEINGKTYEPKKPTVRMWRELVEQDEKIRNENFDLSDRINEWLSTIAEVYGVDSDEMGDMAVEDIFPLYSECAKYIFGAALGRLEKLPNAEAAEKPQN